MLSIALKQDVVHVVISILQMRKHGAQSFCKAHLASNQQNKSSSPCQKKKGKKKKNGTSNNNALFQKNGKNC